MIDKMAEECLLYFRRSFTVEEATSPISLHTKLHELNLDELDFMEFYMWAEDKFDGVIKEGQLSSSTVGELIDDIKSQLVISKLEYR